MPSPPMSLHHGSETVVVRQPVRLGMCNKRRQPSIAAGALVKRVKLEPGARSGASTVSRNRARQSSPGTRSSGFSRRSHATPKGSLPRQSAACQGNPFQRAFAQWRSWALRFPGSSAVPTATNVQPARPVGDGTTDTIAAMLCSPHLPGWSTRLVLYVGGHPREAKALACTCREIAIGLILDVQQVSAEIAGTARQLAQVNFWGEREDADLESAKCVARMLAALLPTDLSLRHASTVSRVSIGSQVAGNPSSTFSKLMIFAEATAGVNNARLRRVDLGLARLADRGERLAESMAIQAF